MDFAMDAFYHNVFAGLYFLRSSLVLETPRHKHGSTIVECNLVVLGGWSTEHFKQIAVGELDNVEVHDLASNSSSTRLSQFPFKTGGSAMVSNHRQLYVVGGYYQGHRSAEVHRACWPTGQWSSVAPMTTQRSFCGAVVWKEFLFALGGRGDNGACLSSMEYLSLVGKEADWTAVAGMLEARSSFATAMGSRFLYVFGGFGKGDTPLKSAEVYDFETNLWTELPDMIIARAECSAIILDRFIMVSGGTTKDPFQKGAVPSIEVFDICKNGWLHPAGLPRMRFCRRGHKLHMFNQSIYVVGGEDEQGNDVGPIEVMDIRSASALCHLPLPPVIPAIPRGNLDKLHCEHVERHLQRLKRLKQAYGTAVARTTDTRQKELQNDMRKIQLVTAEREARKKELESQLRTVQCELDHYLHESGLIAMTQELQSSLAHRAQTVFDSHIDSQAERTRAFHDFLRGMPPGSIDGGASSAVSSDLTSAPPMPSINITTAPSFISSLANSDT